MEGLDCVLAALSFVCVTVDGLATDGSSSLASTTVESFVV